MKTVDVGSREPLLYVPLREGRAPSRALIAMLGPCEGRRFAFRNQVEIGRWAPGPTVPKGTIWVANPTVSRRHCVVTQDDEGRCWVRDVSRNGTHIDHHRLMPGAEVELKPGQVLHVADGVAFRLAVPEEDRTTGPARRSGGTLAVRDKLRVTVLTGDIRRYTVLVREAPTNELQQSVRALFRELEAHVTDLDGTVKEYPGDAILAYWEDAASESCAVRACRAALALDQAAERLARERTVWRLPDRPLQMDWALATGEVLVDSLGGGHPVGLSVVGSAVVLAARLEKLAGEKTAPLLACACTKALAEGAFLFRDLGPMAVTGFEHPQAVFALEGPR
jgi:class 3 adenylate cyclase